jgi:uncharacterized protein (DUF488 family)
MLFQIRQDPCFEFFFRFSRNDRQPKVQLAHAIKRCSNLHMLYTIGHSNHLISTFIELLKQHHISALADVRSHPVSRYAPQYSRNNLQQSLQEAGITYVFLGKELGARSNNPDCYIDGPKGKTVSYALLAQQPIFHEGLERVKKGMEKYRVALMCAEKDPMNCHRALLVSHELFKSGIEISHILADGSLESHIEIEVKREKENTVENHDLFSAL